MAKKIAIIVGSLRKDSINKKLAQALMKLGPKDFSFQMVEIGDLPLYNQDEENNPTDAVKRLKNEISAADAILFVTPEYNRSVPGVLKNAIDHASRPYGQNSWRGKPAGIVGTSPGSTGTAMAQQHLRNILVNLDMPAMAQPEAFVQAREGLFDSKGDIGPDSLKFIQGWMDRFVSWVNRH